MKRQQFGFARCRERNTCSGPDAGPKPPNENKASEKLRAALTHGSVCVPLPGLGVGMAARGPRRRTKSLSCGSSELERERAAWWGSRWQRGASRGPSVDLRCCMLDPETCSARWDVRTYGVRAGFFVGPQTQRWETRTDANQSENAQPSRGPAVSFCVSTVRCLSKWEPSVWYGVCSTSVWITSWIVYLLHWWVAGFWQWKKMFFFGFFGFCFLVPGQVGRFGLWHASRPFSRLHSSLSCQDKQLPHARHENEKSRASFAICQSAARTANLRAFSHGFPARWLDYKF